MSDESQSRSRRGIFPIEGTPTWQKEEQEFAESIADVGTAEGVEVPGSDIIDREVNEAIKRGKKHRRR